MEDHELNGSPRKQGIRWHIALTGEQGICFPDSSYLEQSSESCSLIAVRLAPAKGFPVAATGAKTYAIWMGVQS